ncbi:aspartate ammonia-lyase [Thiothrix eikelboomii]|uniref:Aspartate ammonia-lyase n=1 Tax=Thiothrix eikelboomii TaxID=92487 RepID=A0A1T4XWS7_9GAMM|nr:aspartate ammonia-lyase [Thiothrix eikelboomii]SKA93515.1 aspartate ammonia-lyase [Thiothrix eikelboomii]
MIETTLQTVFPELTSSEIQQLAAITTTKKFAVNDVAIPQEFDMKAGQPRRVLMLIQTGEIEIFRHEEGFQQHIASRYENEILGEEMLLEPEKVHQLSYRSIVETQALVIRRIDMEQLLLAQPEMARKIYRQLAINATRRLEQESHSVRCHSERDSMGEVQIPNDAYYGSQTARAIQNFKITGIPIAHFPKLIKSLAIIKKAAARANSEAPNLKRVPNAAMGLTVGEAIIHACDEIIEGNQFLQCQFLVDVIQGGAGTSTNMNANEVIAKRARELLGFPKFHPEGNPVDPNDDVNMAQSTNDVYPSAVRLTLMLTYTELTSAMQALITVFLAKGEEFASVIKMGRTQLQDAVPMTLGQEFRAFGVTLEEDIDKLERNVPLLGELNLGGTAIGTGILASPDYRARVLDEVNHILQAELKLTHIAVRPALDLVEASWDTGVFVLFSGVIKRIAVKLSKICNDLRLLSSGPLAGFGDIRLPAVQAGSSIMPGKVNPVIPEVVNQVAFQVIGNDLAVTIAAEGGQLQLNAFEPIIAFNLLQSMQMMTRAMRTLTAHVQGIVVTEQDKQRLRERVEQSPGLATFLIPVIGYQAATKIAKEVISSGRSVKDLVLAQGIMNETQWEAFMHPDNLTRPYRPASQAN